MEMQKIKNTLLGLLITGLLVGTAQDILAQRTVIRGERRSNEKRTARTTFKKDKIVKQSGNMTTRKNRTPKSDHTKARYSKNEQRKKGYQGSKNVRKDRISRSDRTKARYFKNEPRKQNQRDFRKDNKSYNRNKKHAYKHRNKKRYYPAKKKWYHRHYRKPAWVDYHRPGYRYPRVGMHVSVLPHGFLSFRIGNFRFYAYRGVYYHYNPALRVFVVVNKPRIETLYTSVTWDRITLVDGSTIEGVYLYSDNDMVFFEVGDALLEIPMSEIKLLDFA